MGAGNVPTQLISSLALEGGRPPAASGHAPRSRLKERIDE